MRLWRETKNGNFSEFHLHNECSNWIEVPCWVPDSSLCSLGECAVLCGTSLHTASYVLHYQLIAKHRYNTWDSWITSRNCLYHSVWRGISKVLHTTHARPAGRHNRSGPYGSWVGPHSRMGYVFAGWLTVSHVEKLDLKIEKENE